MLIYPFNTTSSIIKMRTGLKFKDLIPLFCVFYSPNEHYLFSWYIMTFSRFMFISLNWCLNRSTIFASRNLKVIHKTKTILLIYPSGVDRSHAEYLSAVSTSDVEKQLLDVEIFPAVCCSEYKLFKTGMRPFFSFENIGLLNIENSQLHLLKTHCSAQM